MELRRSACIERVKKEVRAVIVLEPESATAEVGALALPTEVRVDAIDEVDSEIAARGQPRERTPVGTQASDKAVDVLTNRLLKHVARRECPVSLTEQSRSADEAVRPIS